MCSKHSTKQSCSAKATNIRFGFAHSRMHWDGCLEQCRMCAIQHTAMCLTCDQGLLSRSSSHQALVIAVISDAALLHIQCCLKQCRMCPIEDTVLCPSCDLGLLSKMQQTPGFGVCTLVAALAWLPCSKLNMLQHSGQQRVCPVTPSYEQKQQTSDAGVCSG